ncbi:MAG: tryptophan-rich sensory protein, partial [Proteobacteria bacterium]
LRASYIRWALFLVPAIVLLGVLSGQLAGSGADNPWFAALEKPALYPPGWTFGVVWTVLYALMGLALAMILAARGARGRGLATAVFVVQLVLNLAWSPLFFALHQLDGAFYLILAILRKSGRQAFKTCDLPHTFPVFLLHSKKHGIILSHLF